MRSNVCGSRLVVGSLWLTAACLPPRPASEGESDASSGDASAESNASESGGESSAAESSSSDTPETETETETDTGDTSSSEETGSTCDKRIVVTGYWPPTNEMLRPFSQNPDQNPEGWQGEDWMGLGYDIYAFFPEFPPDGDPTNDDIGEPGSVGEGDLMVDYQDTSADFWSFMDELQPQLLVTTSRGGQLGWELEAVEGGHGGPMRASNPAFDWASDQFGDDTRPQMGTVDPRSWEGISTYRDGSTLDSQLPLEAIEAATDALGLVSVDIDYGTSGNYLSGFMGLHGLLYYELAPHAAAAGHIHVGYAVSVGEARQLIDATLLALIEAHPARSVDCPE